MDSASISLSCFLCHETVQLKDKNPRDFKIHMVTKHKAFFNTELSLACSVMDKKVIQNIIEQHSVFKSNDNIKKEDNEYLKEEQIKQEHINSLEKETYKDIKIDAFKGEYIEDENVVVKEEHTFRDNSGQKPSSESEPKSTDFSRNALTYKRPAEELATYKPRLKVP